MPRRPASPPACETPPPSAPTLADVLAAIATADLTPRRRHDMASAVRSVARLLEREPTELPAVPRLLAHRLAKIAPAAHGIAKPRWNNIRWLLRASLALRVSVAPGRQLGGMTPEWQALWRQTSSRRIKSGASRFMRFCSSEKIGPGEVNAAAFERYAESLENSLLESPAGTLSATRSAWTWARAEVPGWPDATLPAAPRREDIYILPWSTFPASLRHEVAAWCNHLAGRDALGAFDFLEEAARRPLRPETLANREHRVRAFASTLVHRGRDPASLGSLADLVELDALKEGLRYLLDDRHLKPGPGIIQYAYLIKIIAKHWVRVSPEHLAGISAVLRNLEARRETKRGGLTETNRRRLRAFDDPDNVRTLICLPERLFALADRMPLGVRAAVLAQTALAIELLLVAPVRIGNLASIDLERHLLRPGRSREKLHLVFEAWEVKNDQELEYPLEGITVALLKRYLTEYRPRLAPPGSTALFPRRDGGAKKRDVLGPRISRVIFEHTELRVNPHLFRHLTSKLYLDAHPGEYGVPQRVLGHKRLATTMNSYTGSETAAAVRQFDEVILRLREQARGATGQKPGDAVARSRAVPSRAAAMQRSDERVLYPREQVQRARSRKPKGRP